MDSNIKRDKKKRGFTLIELLAVIVVLGVVVSVSIYVSVGLINKKDEKVTYINTEAEYKSVLDYATEFKRDNDYEEYINSDDNLNLKFTCVKIKDLVDKGFLPSNKFSNEELSKEMIVVRNENNAYVPYEAYKNKIHPDYCNTEVFDIVIEPESSPNVNGWYKGNVNIKFKVNSNRTDSVTSLKYGINDSYNNNGMVKDYKDFKTFSITTEGKNIKFGVKVKDEEKTHTVNIDKTAPVINSVSVVSYAGSYLKLKMNCTDNLSGVYKVAVTSSNSVPSANSFSLYQPSLDVVSLNNVSVNSSGKNYVWIMDKAGNISSSKAITLDNEPPRINYSWDYSDGECYGSYSDWRKNDRKIKLTFSDNMGIKSYSITNYYNGSKIKSETFSNSPKNISREMYLNKGKYTIKVTDINGYSKTTYVSPDKIDDEAPVFDEFNTWKICDSDGGYTFYYDWVANEPIRKARYQFTTSSSPNEWDWYKRFSDIEYDWYETYYLFVKIEDYCGNETIKRSKANYVSCDDDGGGSSGGGSSQCGKDDDCRKVCLMQKNSDKWWNFSYSPNDSQTRLHAINSIIAGHLTFRSQISYDTSSGVWKYGNERLYNWYNRNCPNTTCGSADLIMGSYYWANKPKDEYKYKDISVCTDADSSYVSGACGSKSEPCYCCPIGTGFYAGSCYYNYTDSTCD